MAGVQEAWEEVHRARIPARWNASFWGNPWGERVGGPTLGARDERIQLKWVTRLTYLAVGSSRHKVDSILAPIGILTTDRHCISFPTGIVSFKLLTSTTLGVVREPFHSRDCTRTKNAALIKMHKAFRHAYSFPSRLNARPWLWLVTSSLSSLISSIAGFTLETITKQSSTLALTSGIGKNLN